MVDNIPSVLDVRDDGRAGVFKVSGSVGVSPNRPVYATGNLQVSQVLVPADRYFGVVAASGNDGDSITVWRRGAFKVWITGAVICGDALVATGTSTAASFKSVASVAAVSGSTYITIANGGFKNAGTALQNGVDGDQILVDLGV